MAFGGGDSNKREHPQQDVRVSNTNYGVSMFRVFFSNGIIINMEIKTRFVLKLNLDVVDGTISGALFVEFN